MSTQQQFEERLEKLNEDFNLFTGRKYPATQKQITEFENKYSTEFSADYKEFLTSYGQMILEVSADVWPRGKEFSVMPAWKFGYGFFVFGMVDNADSPEWLTIDDNGELGQMFFQRSGNRYRAYINKGVIMLEHGEEGFSEEDDFEQFEGNFWSFLITEIDKLDNDYKRIKGE